MRKTGRILAAAIALAFAFAAQAAPEKTVSFDVDMDIGQKLPPYEEMLKNMLPIIGLSIADMIFTGISAIFLTAFSE